MIIEEYQSSQKADSEEASQPIGEELNPSPTVVEDKESPQALNVERETLNVNGNNGLILDIPVRLSVQLGQTEMLFKDVLKLCPGVVIELDESVDEPVDLLVNGKLIAKGEVVTVEGRLGVRVLNIAHSQNYQDVKQG